MVPTALMTNIRVIHVIMLCSYSGEQPRTPQSMENTHQLQKNKTNSLQAYGS